MRRVLIVFIFWISVFPRFANAQSSSPIPLNQHYFEISPKDSANHAYNKLVSYTPDSVKIERFFTLENKLIRIDRTHPKAIEYQEATYEFFDLSGNLIRKTTANLYNSKFLTTYFSNGQQVAQIIYRGEHKFRIQRGETPAQERLDNDFEPHPKEEKSDFNSFISKRIGIPADRWPKERLTVAVAVLVNESGEAIEIVWANPLGADPATAQVFVKAVKAWKKGYIPAKDVYGNPVENWMYRHYHAGSSARY